MAVCISKERFLDMMSVSSLNTKIGSLLEATFMHVMVEGEVATVTYHRSGHVYFTIKDDKSSIKCVMWRSNVARMKFRLEQGEHIVIEGSISVYVPRGDYQLIAAQIEPYGKGTLAVAFEQLKNDLQAKGYFDKERKKPMPRFPRKIALVTAAGGAALQDMLKVAAKRWPLSEIIVIDVLVQGEEAAAQIASAIAKADSLGADIIVTGRGGGSLEDLWAFNELEVAEAIYRCKTPIVSAVGHEVDTLISDFVADLRAPTPSAAMEMILPDRNEMLQSLDEIMDRCSRQIGHILDKKAEQISVIGEHFAQRSPLYQLKTLQDRFEALMDDLNTTMHYRLDQFVDMLAPMQSQLKSALNFSIRQKEGQIAGLSERLMMLDPAKRSKEGFAEITMDGKRTDLGSINVGDVFDLSTDKYKMKVKSLEKLGIRND